ncbi:3-oxoacyl-ACP reductase FabG [Achromobacter xylosoxidans]
MDLQLTGKVAVITGSGRGIGYASALALAREGARIVITDIDPDSVRQAVAGLKEAGFEAIGAVLDVCDDGHVRAMADEAARAYGGIDILVNNAGFTRDKYLLKMPEADWDAVVDTILKGAYHCTRAALPSMMERKWGRVINIASRAHWGNPGQTNYSAAKAGLIGFTRALALEQGKFNITANAIAPGLIETPLVRGLSTYDMLRANALARQPVQRLGVVEDIANAVAFLASERASFITGELLHVTGERYAS